jgi:hypothetical protein
LNPLPPLTTYPPHYTFFFYLPRVIKLKKGGINGTIRLMWQPAEEGGAGGLRMIEEGVLTKYPPVQNAFGFHQVWLKTKTHLFRSYFFQSKDFFFLNTSLSLCTKYACHHHRHHHHPTTIITTTYSGPIFLSVLLVVVQAHSWQQWTYLTSSLAV